MTHSPMGRDLRVTLSNVRPFAAALLLVWVLVAHVFVAFPRARTKLVTRPIAVAPRVALPLDAADRMPGEEVVLVYRVRNAGTAPLVVTARVADRVLRDVRIAGGESSRVDLTFPRSLALSGGHSIELSGSADWTLEYAELANVHGFTRGAVEFLVLPAVQPFLAPKLPTVVAFAACALTAACLRLPRLPRWAQLAHGVVTTAMASLCLLALVSPWVTPYRVVFAVHTFVLGAAVFVLPRTLQLLVEIGRSRTTGLIARRAVALPWTAIGIGVAAAAYTVFLWSYMGAVAGGADSSGYMNSARLMAQGRVSAPVRRVSGLAVQLPQTALVPLGFRPHGPDAMVPTYPIGLPLAIAASATACGWERAADIPMLAHSLVGIALTAMLTRRCGLSRRAGFIAALLLATSPLYLFISLQLMSDTAALVWTTMAVVLAWDARSRAQSWRDVCTGIAASIAVLVRPTNVLVLLPLAVCIGLAWRRWLMLAAGSVPAGVLLLAYNVAAYHDPITTGYGDMGYRFTVGNVIPSLRNYATWLPVLLTPIGLLALGLPAIVTRLGRIAAVLTAWAAGYLVLYAFYYHTHEWWWYLRFLLPAFPPLIVGALCVGGVVWRAWGGDTRVKRATTVLAMIVAGLIAAHNYYWGSRLHVLEIGRNEGVYPQTAAWATANLPQDAPVLAMQASGSFFYYTNFTIVRWDRCDRTMLTRLERRALAAGRPLYAVLFPFEINQLHAFDRMPGRWTQIGRIRHVTIWKLEAS
jgi:hypothetical protein